MRQIATKTDNTGDVWSANPFNTWRDELERVATTAGFTLDPEAGPDTNLKMLVQSISLYAAASRTYDDSGSANAYVLSVVGNLEPIDKYIDGLEAIFLVGNTNTGASTVNIETIGVKSLTLPSGIVLTGGELIAGQYVKIIYDLTNNRFELLGLAYLDNIIRTAIASGTVDAITATFTPVVAVLKDPVVVFVDTTGTNTVTNPTFQADSTTAKTITKNGGQALVAGEIPAGKAIFQYDLSGDNWELLNPVARTGKIQQVINVEDGEVNSGSTQIPFDDTIPQITEGNEFMTLVITPLKTTNKLKIDVVVNISHNQADVRLVSALFQDAIVNALAVGMEQSTNAATSMVNIKFTYTMTAGTLSSITFRVRCGGNVAGTTTFNGVSNSRRYGGVMSSSITITEIEA
jgi:hypothetical protein